MVDTQLTPLDDLLVRELFAFRTLPKSPDEPRTQVQACPGHPPGYQQPQGFSLHQMGQFLNEETTWMPQECPPRSAVTFDDLVILSFRREKFHKPSTSLLITDYRKDSTPLSYVQLLGLSKQSRIPS